MSWNVLLMNTGRDRHIVDLTARHPKVFDQ
jgi:hypothetical protein